MKKISDYLREEREGKGLTLLDVAKVTKIRKEFLTMIEEGSFDTLPSESYALGFVKTYAEFLDIPRNKAVAMYRRENEIEALNVVPNYQKKQHHFQRKIISPKIILALVVSLAVLFFIAFQFSSFFFGPSLKIISPQDGEVIEGNQTTVIGETNPYATVLIDGEETRVQIDGTFEKDIFIFTGEKEISIVAKNRFGKESRQTLTVRVK